MAAAIFLSISALGLMASTIEAHRKGRKSVMWSLLVGSLIVSTSAGFLWSAV
jgi:hypothetical protein